MQIRKYLLLFTLVLSISCSRLDENEGKSKLSIIAPSKQQLMSKVGSLAAFPAAYDYCYGVNIKAPDLISQDADQCKPEQGLFSGYVAAGSAIEILAPRGSDRDIYVYLHLVPIGTPCSQVNFMQQVDLQKVYKIGEALDIDFDRPTINVSIQADFPGLSNHVANTLNAPATCFASNPGLAKPGAGEVLNGGGIVSGSTFKIKSKIGSHSNNEITGSSFKVKGL